MYKRERESNSSVGCKFEQSMSESGASTMTRLLHNPELLSPDQTLNLLKSKNANYSRRDGSGYKWRNSLKFVKRKSWILSILGLASSPSYCSWSRWAWVFWSNAETRSRLQTRVRRVRTRLLRGSWYLEIWRCIWEQCGDCIGSGCCSGERNLARADGFYKWGVELSEPDLRSDGSKAIFIFLIK